MRNNKIKFVNYENSDVIQTIEYLEPSNKICKFRKIGKNEIVNIETGEVINTKHAENKADSIESVRNSMFKAYDLLKNNFFDEETVYSIEVTYKENPKNYREYERHLNNLSKKLRRRNRDVKYMFFKEIGKKGQYHAHLIISNISLDKNTFCEIWTHGFYRFKILKTRLDIMKKGMYLTNLSGDSEKSLKKLENLKQFPPNKRLYSKSKNLNKPTYKKGNPNVEGYEEVFKTPTEKAKRLRLCITTYQKAS